MTASKRSVNEVIDVICRWQVKHVIPEEDIDELLNALTHIQGNASFEMTMNALLTAYRERHQ